MTKVLILDEDKLFLLYRAMVAEIIEANMIERLLDCDIWTFTEALDMSFEEIVDKPFYLWQSIIQKDLLEFLGKKQH